MTPLNDALTFMRTVNVYNVVTREATRNQFLELFGYTFGWQPACMACPGDIEAAIGKLNWLLKRMVGRTEVVIKADEIMTYNMKPGARVYSSKLRLMVTHLNCTDEVAEVLIAENPKNAAFFSIKTKAGEATAYTATPAKPTKVGNPPAKAPEPAVLPVEEPAKTAPKPAPAAKSAPAKANTAAEVKKPAKKAKKAKAKTS